MSVVEIISGVVLIISCVVIVGLVLLQDSKGNGLAGAIGGGEMLDAANRLNTKDVMLARLTKIAAIVLFVVTLLVGLFSIYLK